MCEYDIYMQYIHSICMSNIQTGTLIYSPWQWRSTPPGEKGAVRCGQCFCSINTLQDYAWLFAPRSRAGRMVSAPKTSFIHWDVGCLTGGGGVLRINSFEWCKGQVKGTYDGQRLSANVHLKYGHMYIFKNLYWEQHAACWININRNMRQSRVYSREPFLLHTETIMKNISVGY